MDKDVSYLPRNFFFFRFIYLVLAVLGLRCYLQTFPSCREHGTGRGRGRGYSLLPFMGVSLQWFLLWRQQLQASELQQLWLAGLVAMHYVGSSQSRYQTCVPFVSRMILNPWTTGKPEFVILEQTPQSLSSLPCSINSWKIYPIQSGQSQQEQSSLKITTVSGWEEGSLPCRYQTNQHHGHSCPAAPVMLEGLFLHSLLRMVSSTIGLYPGIEK